MIMMMVIVEEEEEEDAGEIFKMFASVMVFLFTVQGNLKFMLRNLWFSFS